MKSKLLILLCVFCASICSAQVKNKKSPSPTRHDTLHLQGHLVDPGYAFLKDTLRLGESWESNYTIPERTPWPEPDYKPIELLQATETWKWDSASIRTFTLVYVNQAGVSTRLWMMTQTGKTLHIDSTGANSFFERSDTIIVAGKVFVYAMPVKKAANVSPLLFGW